MDLNIKDLISNYTNENTVSELSSHLGESAEGVTKAIKSFLPLVFGQVSKVIDTPEIFSKIKNLDYSQMLNSEPAKATENSLVSSLLPSLFSSESKVSQVVDYIAKYSNISPASSSKILGFSTSSLLGHIAKMINVNNLDISSVANIFNSGNGLLSSLLPSGLSLAGLGLASSNLFSKVSDTVADTASSVKQTTTETVNTIKNEVTAKKKKGISPFIWLILALLLAFLLYKQCSKPVTQLVSDGVDKTKEVAQATVDKTKEVTGSAVDSFKDKLGALKFKGNLLSNGFENSLVSFVQNDYPKLSEDQLKDKWFNFDNVRFKFNSNSELEDGSLDQLENLASILKLMPEAKIIIGSYTDKKGDVATNQRISQERADFIKAKLTDLGVGSQIAEAKGYGSEFATVDESASDEARSVDRKIAIRFTK